MASSLPQRMLHFPKIDPKQALAYGSTWHCYTTRDSVDFSDFETEKSAKPTAAFEIAEGVIESITPTTAFKKPSEALIQAAQLWHVRLGHISLDLLKKTAQVTKGMPNFQKVRSEDLVCKSCDSAKILCKLSKRPVVDSPFALGRLEGNIFVIRLTPLNNKALRSCFSRSKNPLQIYSSFKNEGRSCYRG